MKKIIVLCLLFVLLCIVFVGCSKTTECSIVGSYIDGRPAYVIKLLYKSEYFESIMRGESISIQYSFDNSSYKTATLYGKAFVVSYDNNYSYSLGYNLFEPNSYVYFYVRPDATKYSDTIYIRISCLIGGDEKPLSNYTINLPALTY